MDLLNTTLGAVGQVGDAIDKYTGGRAVRGTLAGKPRELASIVPFSDSLGITRPEDATSGRDLTDSYGLTTKGSNSFGSHAAGFVADNVLSPANWLGAGAAFKAAPTLAKGAVGAAKALTGADLLDHVAGGAKKLGSFLGGESGAVLMPGAGGYDDAIKAYEANKHLIAKKGPDGAFVDAIDAMKLPRNVEDTVYHVRNNMSDFGKADVSGDERVGTDLWNRLQHAGEDFFGDESGALDIGAFGSKSRSGLAPQTMASTKVNTAIQEAANQFGGRGWHGPTQYGEPTDLAARFIRPPELPSNPDQAKQIADHFTDTIAKGRESASAYFGPMYYDINDYLRTLGPEAAQAEVQAIREGRARVPAQSAPKAAAASIDNWDDTPTLSPSPFQNIPAAPTFIPDKSLLDSFSAKHGMDPYELMGETSGSHYHAAMDSHFGAQSPAYNKFFEDMAKADGTWTGADEYLGAGHATGGSGVASAFTPDPAKLAEFDKLAGVPHKDTLPADFTNKSDFGGVQAVGKQVFGDQYDQYVNHIKHINGDDIDFNLPGSPKTDAFDEADFFGLPPDGASDDFSFNPPLPASHSSKASSLAKDALNPDEAFLLDGVRRHIAGLSGLIDHSALPQDMDLFRGVDGPGARKISGLIGAPLSSPEAVGREFVDPAFMSTAFVKKTADEFAGLSSGYNRPDSGVTFTFPQVPAGKPASFMNASENEILFPPGRKIKITDNSNYPHLKAELYGTLLAAILGRQAAQYGGQNGNP